MPVIQLVVINILQPLAPPVIEDPTAGLLAALDSAERIRKRRTRLLNQLAGTPVEAPAPVTAPGVPESLCVFEQLAWVPTTEGALSIREVYERAHEIEGLSPRLTGAEYSSVIRLFASLTALMCRTGQGMKVPAESFPAADIDRLAELVRPHMDLFHPTRPFLQRHPEDASEYEATAKPARLYPWKQSEGADLFFDRAEEDDTFDLPTAVMALSVFSTHSIGANVSFNGVLQGYGSPGLQHPGSFPAVEVMFAGRNLFETLLVTTPRDWVTGGGLPAWMDRWCASSQHSGEPMTMWRQTWGPNQVIARWDDTRTRLVGVATGGGLPLAPGLGVPQGPPLDPERAAELKLWHEQRVGFTASRRHEDPYYLWSMEPLKKPKGDQTHKLVAHRPVMGYAMGETLASWHKGPAAKALHDGGRRFVVDADAYDYVTFISHVLRGSSLSAQMRSSVVRRENASTWVSDAVHGDSMMLASDTLMAVSKAVTQPWINFQSVSLKIRATRMFWTAISSQTRTFFDDPTSVNRQEYWSAVHQAALESFDRTSSMLGVGVGGHRVEAERARLVNVLRKMLVTHL